MTIQIASPVSTGGYGTDFERNVVAWVAMHLLRDKPILTDEGGLIQRLDVQMRVDGWVLDDLVLERGGNDGQVSKIAVTVKSAPRFGPNCWPADVLEPLWDQYLNRGAHVFDAANDYLCLIAGDLEETIYRNLRALIQLSRGCEASTFVERMTSDSNFCTAHVRNLWNAASCPVPESNANVVDQARLLSRLRLIKLDFRDDHSSARQEARTLCSEALANPTEHSADNLWLQVRNLVCEIEPVSGGLTRTKILARLRTGFQLKAAPFYEPDYERLDRDSGALRGQVLKHTGPERVKLGRNDLKARLHVEIETAQIVFVVGGSGTGKSALCAELDCEFLWWLSAIQLQKSTLSEFESSLGITNRLDRLLPAVPNPNALVCIDGFDNSHEEDASLWNTFASLTQILFSPESAGNWKVLLPVQPSAVERINDQLYSRNIEVNSVVIEVPNWTEEEWLELTQHYPWIQSAAQRSGAAALFKIPKLTDWLINRGEAIFQQNPSQPTPLVERLWGELIVRAGNPELAELRKRDRILPEIAARIADANAWTFKSADLPDDILPVVDSLSAADVIVIKNDVIYFSHDLAADWSRAIYLSRTASPIDGLADREALPQWHRAVRLWSAGLLDGDQESFDIWLSILDSVQERRLIRTGDLWVEGIIHSQAPASVLSKLKTRNDFDTLFQRFLSIFEVSGTVAASPPSSTKPSLRLLETLGNLVTAPRQPTGTAWIGLFEFLRENLGQLSEKSSVLVCRLARIWLNSKSMAVLHNRTTLAVAGCVLDIGERFVREDLVYFEEGRTVTEAVGAAFNQLPVRAKTVFFQLAGLQEIPPLPFGGTRCSASRGRRLRQAEEHVETWPGGARWRVNDTFADAALSGNALVKVAQAEPSFTLEILYALLLEDANERADSLQKDRGKMHESLFPNCSLSYRRNSHPQGVSPIFLLLAMTRPRETLRFALDLVAFVSDRWHERFVKFDVNSVTLVIPASDSGRTWRSFPMLKRFNWKILPHPVDKILGTIAQSWNRRLAAGEDLTDEFASVLSEGGSTPVLDLLIAIGLGRPSLFVGPLFDLATCPILCQRHSHLMRVLHTLVKVKPETSITIDSTMKWWSDEARRREWNEEFQEMLSRWRNLALSEHLDEDEWNRFFGVEPSDPISVENCIVVLKDPRPLLNQGLPADIRTMLEERLSLEPEPAAPTSAGESDEDQVLDPIEAKRCAAAAILVTLSLVSKDVSPGVLALCRGIILSHAQTPSAQPNGIYTHFNYGFSGRMNYERQEAAPMGMTAYALPALLVSFPDDPEVRLSFARTMFAREIIFTDMMWKSINLLRQWLEDDYVRSLHLVLRVAAVREGNRCLGGYFGPDRDSHEKATETAASTKLEQLCEEFATRTISASIPDWNAIIAEECDPIRATWAKAQHPSERRKSGGFDTYLMNHSEPNSLQRADGIIDLAFMSWWQGCADYIHWCEANDETSRQDRWSQEHFRSWAQSLAQISVLIGDGGIAKPLWLPILNLAPSKIENVTEFLNYWWQEAINRSLSETSVAGFVEAFVSFLRTAAPLAGASDFYSAEMWTAALGLQNEFRALGNRPADVRCPPALLAEFGPLLVATKRDSSIRGTAHYLSLGFSGVEDRDSLQWFADEVIPASYLVGQAETAKVLLQMLIAMKRRSQSAVNLPQFRKLLNTLASHPWPDAVRVQQELSTPQ